MDTFLFNLWQYIDPLQKLKKIVHEKALARFHNLETVRRSYSRLLTIL
jgi:hypothetical protein